jgi:GT2 family glycosyltransferase
MKLDLTIAIISFNSGALIAENFKELILDKDIAVTVVDNHSTDGNIELVRDISTDTHIIELRNNIGYGRAANVAIHSTKTRFLLLLNPDIEVSVEEIKQFYYSVLAESRKAVIYAPATTKGELTNSGWVEVRGVLGAVMLFDLERLKPYGYFDENLFLFYEEKDLCKRVVDAGDLILRLSDNMFKHDKGTSSGVGKNVYYLKQWHVAWSSAYYLKKHQLDTGRHRLGVMMLRYTLKYLLSLSGMKRLKYKARISGLFAYLLGKKAFDKHGLPQKIEHLK